MYRAQTFRSNIYPDAGFPTKTALTGFPMLQPPRKNLGLDLFAFPIVDGCHVDILFLFNVVLLLCLFGTPITTELYIIDVR